MLESESLFRSAAGNENSAVRTERKDPGRCSPMFSLIGLRGVCSSCLGLSGVACLGLSEVDIADLSDDEEAFDDRVDFMDDVFVLRVVRR